MNLSHFNTITFETLYVLSSEALDVDNTLKVQQKLRYYTRYIAHHLCDAL